MEPHSFAASRVQALFQPTEVLRLIYAKLRVESRITSSGATFLWVARMSRFSRTALMPSTTMPTADAPMDSMGWRTVVREGV